MANRMLVPRWLALLCCAALTLAACGSNADPDADASRDVQLPASNPYGGDLEAEGEPVRGGTMTIGMIGDVRGFDPIVQAANLTGFAIYDSLMRLEPDGRPVPYLAKGMETSDNGRTWTMTLREGVRFHDDTPLDAEAVIFNVQRHRDNPSSPGNQFARDIESMRAVGPLTVEFVLRRPSGEFPTAFASTWAYGGLGIIGSPTAIRERGEAYTRNPVGAGPYRFVEWIEDSRVVLERNDNYWQEGKPYLDRLVFRPLPDTEARYASLENGDVDMILAGYHSELIRAMDNPDLTVYYGSGSGAEWLNFNHQEPPFDDRRMREAVVRAINLDALSATQYRGRMERADSIFGRNSEYYSEEAGRNWPDYDPERARQLIREYQADGGNTNIVYKTTNAPNRLRFAEFLQSQLAEVGIDMRPEFFDLAGFSSSVVQSGDFQLTGWVDGPWDNPYPPVSNLFHSEGIGNYGGYSNPEVDRALEQAITTTDQDERVELYRRVQEMTNEDIVVAYYSRGYLSTLTQSDVRGVVRYLSRDMFYADLWLDR